MTAEREPVPAPTPVLVGAVRAVYIVLTGLFVVAIGAFTLHWLRGPGPSAEPATWGVVTLLWLAIVGRHALAWAQLPRMRRAPEVVAPEGLRVALATAIVPSAEPLELLAQELRALARVRYPHDTWVLDEEDDPRVHALARAHGARYFTRAGRPELQAEAGPFERATKHGNYNAWLADIGYARYDVLTQIDLDHVPQPSYLDRVLGHLRDPRVGFVAAPPSFSNEAQSCVTRAACEESRRFHSATPQVAYGMQFVLGNGSHFTHRVAAVEEIGGMAPHQADDTLTSLRYQAAGWHGVWVHEVLARGLQPATWPAYLNQQQRWASADVDCRLRARPSPPRNTPWAGRLQHRLFGLWYAQMTAQYLALYGLLIAALAAGRIPAAVSASLTWPGAALVAAIFVCQEYRAQCFSAEPHRPALAWRVAVLHFVKWPIVLRAVFDGVTNRVTARRRGPALTHKGAGPPARYSAAPHVVAAAGALVALVGGASSGMQPVVLWVLGLGFVAAELGVYVALARPPAQRAEHGVS